MVTKNVPRRTYNHRERSEMMVIFKWFCLQYPSYKHLFCHVANESQRSYAEWANLKKMGFKKGFSDIFLPHPNSRYPGLFIELKSKNPNGNYHKATESQLKFIDDMRAEGYFARVCKGADDAIEVLSWYMLFF